MQLFQKYFALIAIILLFPFAEAKGQESIEELIETANLRDGSVAMRDVSGWDPTSTIIFRGNQQDWAWLESRFGSAKFEFVGSLNEALAVAAGAGAIIGFCNDELLATAPSVTWVQIWSAGAERCVSLAEKFPDGVILTNMQKMLAPVIAEHAIAMLLALTRRLTTFSDAMEEAAWNREWSSNDAMTTVRGKTMLVLGLGGIGTEVARRAAALGMRVVATRNSSRRGPDFVDYVGLSDEMFELARDADVIVNALPLTDATRGLLGREFFGSDFSKQPYFINVGRGATVDTQALLDALESGRLAGAGLDVTDPEPLPRDHALWRQKNVLITPHVAWQGDDGHRRRLLVAENIRRYLAGDALLNVVIIERGY